MTPKRVERGQRYAIYPGSLRERACILQKGDNRRDMRLIAHRPGTECRIRVSPNTCRSEAGKSLYIHEEAQLELEGPFVMLSLRADRAWVSREDLSIDHIFEYGTRKIYTRVSSDSHDRSTTAAVA